MEKEEVTMTKIELTNGTLEEESEKKKETKKPNWQGAVIEDKSVWFAAKCGSWDAAQVRFNPIVSIISFLLILGFVTYCIVDTAKALASFKEAKFMVAKNFTWLYVGSFDMWALVLLAIYFSKYGNLKLGKDDDEVEYPDGSWFCMLFACGVGVGLFFYGVGEPISHYTSPNRYTADRYMPDNMVAQDALNQTFYHWGFHPWVTYGIMGIVLAFVTFRKGLPMTMKSCFYPLIGDRIYGWMGNVIDIMSVITTVFGVCTSLGLGTMQLNAGLNYIFPSIEKNTLTQVLIIWIVMAVATVSVVSGVGVGVRRLSEICFGVGMFLLMATFFLDDSWFLLNLFCQTVGYYIQNFLGLGFRTDAFELVGIKSSLEGDRGRLYGVGEDGEVREDGLADGPQGWMDGWTIFYWGWWVSWSPFVGMFIAKISKGRTIKEFINGALTAPMIYSFLWLTIFGGSALWNEKYAAEQHTVERPFCCPADPEMLDWAGAYKADISKWDEVLVSGLKDTYNKKTGRFACGGVYQEYHNNVGDKWLNGEENNLGNFEKFYKVDKNRYKMSMSEDNSIVRISCLKLDDQWFALMYTKGKLGTMLSVVSLFGIVLYFVTSADSGSLVIDIMAANGDQNPPRLQRVFWAMVEGATATALLIAGGKEALSAVQTASIVTGLPYTIIMSFLCVSLWRGLAMEFGDLNPYGADFSIGIIDPFATWDPKLWCNFAKYIFMTPLVLYKTNMRQGGQKTGSTMVAIAASVLWLSWITLHIVEIEVPGSYAIAWIFYIGFVTLVASFRSSVRAEYDINGNPLEDFFATLLVYPSVAIQLETVHMKQGLTTIVPQEPVANGNGATNGHHVNGLVIENGNSAAHQV
ncbi:uncharacterized protein LOC134813142 [Bolinopsis microptera]|uniref:uncharacterized protein LOC134813142 n=1 Tax=Bolinopsis microptera TaxID=2820187 RepID=UPI003078D819